MTSPILRYHGGKWRLAPWILERLPAHRVYLEPYCGAASLLLRKERCDIEIINDLNGRLVNLFRVIRERPQELAEMLALSPYSESEYQAAREVAADSLEDARRMLILGWQGHGSTACAGGRLSGWRRGVRQRGPHSANQWARLPDSVHEFAQRLAGVFIEQRPALELIDYWGSEEGALIYCDPPYLPITRGPGEGTRGYAFEMTEDDHIALAKALHASPAAAAISHYPCDLYSELYSDWECHSREALADGAAARIECLWVKPRNHQARQMTFSF